MQFGYPFVDEGVITIKLIESDKKDKKWNVPYDLCTKVSCEYLDALAAVVNYRILEERVPLMRSRIIEVFRASRTALVYAEKRKSYRLPRRLTM